MASLIVVRHGHTVFNRAGEGERLRAWLDIPLSEQGLAEAADVAAQLSTQPVEFILTSDLHRARQTAELIRAKTGVPLIPTASLRPWNLGSLAGEKVADILATLNRLQAQPDRRAPGGESLNEFFGRYSAHLRDLMLIAGRARSTVIAVTHVRNFLATPVVLSGGEASSVPVKGGPQTGSMLVLEQRNGKWIITVEPAWGDIPVGRRGKQPALFSRATAAR
jgi:broad specificity phosphatase PhoE